MTGFRILLVALISIVGIYTVFVVAEHGMDFLSPFYGDIAKMGWPGQFNLDFHAFLILGSLWLMWRHHFSPLGLLFGIIIFGGGAPFLCIYMLVVMLKDKADMAELLLGKRRVAEIRRS
ncbi:MAG: hypothetical protein IBJ12_06620 [Sphingomonadaceae bacterium]|nr:hypothetical protein [Sphingomonadaceae bacterium]